MRDQVSSLTFKECEKQECMHSRQQKGETQGPHQVFETWN